MLSFAFRVNHSFKNGAGHPITIPRSQISHGLLEPVLARGSDAVVRLPDGSWTKASVKHGVSGYGPYYQLRFASHSEWASDRAELGSLLTVDIARVESVLCIGIAAR